VRLDLADGFDFPVGKPNADKYYKARGYWPGGHHGEDWNGKGGGNTDLGDPVYSCGDGIVVQSKDCRKGWGNVVIIRHVYRDKSGKIKTIDSLYGHLNVRSVTLNQRVKRGQRIGTIGTNRGMYLAHLHFEIRKNIYIGMHRTKFKNDYSNWDHPTNFIKANRKLNSSGTIQRVAINTFQPYPSSSKVVKRTVPSGANIAKVEQRKIVRIPVESTQRQEVRKQITNSTPSNASRYLSTGSTRRTISPTTQRIVAEEKKKTTSTDRKGFFSRFKSKAQTKAPENAKPIKRRRGLFGRR